MTDMIILRERVITIKTGDTFDQSLQGNVLRVTAGLVPLRVQDRDQQMDFTLLAGERAEFPGEFPGLILSHTSGVDQTFTIQVGKGVNVASALVSGTVAITGTPTVINGGGTLTNITNAVKIIDEGISYGTAYKSSVSSAANGVETIVAPAANVNGLIVHDAGFVSLSGGATLTTLIAKTSAPTSLTDGDVLMIPGPYTPSSVGGGKLNKSVKVAAGKGLYFYTLTAETFGHRHALYTLL